MTPERVAEVLLEEEAGMHRDRRLDTFDRITFDPKIMAGRACIRGMRITVGLVGKLVANGMRVEDIIGEYPVLEPETSAKPSSTRPLSRMKRFTLSASRADEIRRRATGRTMQIVLGLRDTDSEGRSHSFRPDAIQELSERETGGAIVDFVFFD
jgi:uncharacterized protein (DUF433 family)